MWKFIHSLFADAPTQSGTAERAAYTGPAIVALILGEQDRELLTSIACRTQMDVRFTDSCGEAWLIAKQVEAPVILCDRDLPATEWRDLVQILASAHHRPSVILTSKVVDDYLRQEVIRNGGYDVLAKPLREDDVLRSVMLAWQYWSSATKISSLPFKHYRSRK